MEEIKNLLYQDINREDLFNWDKTKRRWGKKLKKIVKSSEIFTAYNQLLAEKKIKPNPLFESTLQIRKVRTLSGVAPFAVMMKPFACPGNCIYCVCEKGMPKSYMSDEPAAARAKKLDFDPVKQVLFRIKQMEETGHHPEKIQIIVIGGTFGAYPKNYSYDFIKSIYDACNGVVSKTIEKAQILNETAKYRVIGMSIETRPDWINEEEIKFLRELGVTKVQLGVQSLNNRVLKVINRGHDVGAVAKATKLLRNSGFKINYHVMPNLPLSSPEIDIRGAKKLFNDTNFKPDTLKIYPTIVLPQTKLFDLWQSGKFRPWDDETLIKTLAEMKTYVKYYCRIDRLVRDITKKWTAAGTTKTNMREMVAVYMKNHNLKCDCIRCREIKNKQTLNDIVKFKIKKYSASGGKEIFLSYESEKYLYAMLRLRFINKADQQDKLFPVLKNSAIIRELQVFGKLMPISQKATKATQHQSLGKKLIFQAEKLAKKAGFEKIAIISGVGVRGYYRKLGYNLKDSYMVKEIN